MDDQSVLDFILSAGFAGLLCHVAQLKAGSCSDEGSDDDEQVDPAVVAFALAHMTVDVHRYRQDHSFEHLEHAQNSRHQVLVAQMLVQQRREQGRLHGVGEADQDNRQHSDERLGQAAAFTDVDVDSDEEDVS